MPKMHVKMLLFVLGKAERFGPCGERIGVSEGGTLGLMLWYTMVVLTKLHGGDNWRWQTLCTAVNLHPENRKRCRGAGGAASAGEGEGHRA